jgi:hypothetical protein
MGWPATGFICARTDGDEKLYLPHRQTLAFAPMALASDAPYAPENRSLWR